jgi:hypothetical protein
VDACCNHEGYGRVFTGRFARRLARRYGKRGLSPVASEIVRFLGTHDISGATVLEIGGGVGEIQIELLRRGAAQATNLEISPNYEMEAAVLLEQSGLAGRVSRRFVDIATSPHEVQPADIVVLHRVVCCYPDYERLLWAAGSHARRMLAFSHPPGNVVIRTVAKLENLMFRLRGDSYRAYVHPPTAMLATLQRQGLSVQFKRRRRGWYVVGLAR